MIASTESSPRAAAPQKPPMPVIRKMRWPFPIIWIVPLAAACLAGYFFYLHHQDTGSVITIHFNDGSGIQADQTALSVHGVYIGKVKTVSLDADHRNAVLRVQLERSAEFIMRAGTAFWLVRPEVSLQNITGLNTLVSGPYIDCQPGDGVETHTFKGLDSPPLVIPTGVRLVLLADQLGQLTLDSPVSFRGEQVGTVRDIRLSHNADAIAVSIILWDRYKYLARTHSKFWMVKGADVKGSLLGGVSLKLGSVQNLLNGGITFLTPDCDFGQFVEEGSTFILHDQPKDEWLGWKAQIQLPPEAPAPTSVEASADVQQNNSKQPKLNIK